MALPTKANIEGLNYSLNGSPWCVIPSKTTIESTSLSFSLNGSIWWAIKEAVVITGRKWNTAIITKFNTATVTKINGV